MTETAPRPVAIVRDYAQLHAALRARADEIGISRIAIDDVGGLTPGHASKLLAPVPIKFLGRTSLGLVLGALGLALMVVEDPEALARTRRMAAPREECHVGNSETKFAWRARRRAAAADAG